MGDHYEWALDLPVCRRASREEIIHSTTMGETRNYFVNKRLPPHGAADRHDLKIVGLARDKMMRVEAPQLSCPYTARHRGNVIHIRLARHRRHRSIDVLREEFSAQMLLPERDNLVFVHLDLNTLRSPRICRAKRHRGPRPLVRRHAHRCTGKPARPLD